MTAEAGDVVKSENGNYYAVAAVYSEATDGHSLMLLEIGGAIGAEVFYPFGRWRPADVRVIEKARYAASCATRAACAASSRATTTT